MGLHACIHLFVGQVNALMEKRLPHLIESSIVEVLGLEGGIINDGIARVTSPDAMLLNELHGVHSSETKGRGVPSGNEPTLPLSFVYRRQTDRKVLSCEMGVLITSQKKVRAIFGLLHFRIGFACCKIAVPESRRDYTMVVPDTKRHAPIKVNRRSEGCS